MSIEMQIERIIFNRESIYRMVRIQRLQNKLSRFTTLIGWQGDNSHKRIKAKQILGQLQKELIYAIEEEKIKEEQRIYKEQIRKELNPNSEDKVAYTHETRKRDIFNLKKERKQKERQRNDGKIRQFDEGGYKHYLNNWEYIENIIFKKNIPIYCDASLIQVNVIPTYVSVRNKDEDIFAERSKIQRSEITEELLIIMPKVNPNEMLKQIIERQKKEKQQKQQQQIKYKELQQKQERQNLDLLIQKVQTKLTQQIDNDIPELE